MKTKNVILEIEERVYNELMQGSKRLRGTIGMRPDGTCDFHLHSRGDKAGKQACATQKLPHGRCTITAEKLRLSITVNHRTETTPVAEMLIDTLQAKEFANEVIYGVSGYPYGINY